MKKSVRRGRPRKSAITKLKVMAWFNAVAQASGKTAAELEREFADPNHIWRSKDKNKEIRPGLWDKYRRGEVEPRALPSKGKLISVVQAVESKYPGTAKWLTLPLWKLLDFSQPVTMEELREIYDGMPPEIRGLIVKDSVLEGEIFWRRQTNEAKLQQQFGKISNDIDRLTAALALVRESILLQQESLYRIRMDALRTKLEIFEIEECICNWLLPGVLPT